MWVSQSRTYWLSLSACLFCRTDKGGGGLYIWIPEMWRVMQIDAMWNSQGQQELEGIDFDKLW